MTALLATRVARADAASIADAVRSLPLADLSPFDRDRLRPRRGCDRRPRRPRLYKQKAGRHSIRLSPTSPIGRRRGGSPALTPTPQNSVRRSARPADARIAEGVILSGRLACTAGLDSIAVRVPDNTVARDILKAFGKPVVAPSANRSGHISPTTAAHVQADLGGRIDSSSTADRRRSASSRRSSPARRADAVAAGRRAARGDRGVSAGRLSEADAGLSGGGRGAAPPGMSPPLTVRAPPKSPHAANAEAVSTPDEVLLGFGSAQMIGAKRARTALNPSAWRSLEGRLTISAFLARTLYNPARERDSGNADPRRRSWRSHQRSPQARRGGASAHDPEKWIPVFRKR